MGPCDPFRAPLAVPEIAALAARRDVGARIEAWIGHLTRLFPRVVALQVLHRAGFRNILAIWDDQLTKSRLPQAPVDPAIRQPYPSGFRLGRPHHQLPCTLPGLAAKVARITEAFGPEARILLIGDDDQLSPVLIRAGYRNVFVVDIDADLVAHLRRCCGGAVRARVHDIGDQAPSEWVGPFDLIVLDPPYQAAGVTMFLEGALRFAVPNSRPRIHLYCASACLTPEGITAVQAFINLRGYDVARFVPAACHYPYPWLTRACFIALFAAVAATSGAPRLALRPSLLPRHVGSDLWELVKTAENILHPGG